MSDGDALPGRAAIFGREDVAIGVRDDCQATE
jgi:hypothetical protein